MFLIRLQKSYSIRKILLREQTGQISVSGMKPESSLHESMTYVAAVSYKTYCSLNILANGFLLRAIGIFQILENHDIKEVRDCELATH